MNLHRRVHIVGTQVVHPVSQTDHRVALGLETEACHRVALGLVTPACHACGQLTALRSAAPLHVMDSAPAFASMLKAVMPSRPSRRMRPSELSKVACAAWTQLRPASKIIGTQRRLHNSSLLWLGLARTTRSSHRAAARTDGAENRPRALSGDLRARERPVQQRRLKAVCDVVSIHARTKGVPVLLLHGACEKWAWRQGMRQREPANGTPCRARNAMVAL